MMKRSDLTFQTRTSAACMLKKMYWNLKISKLLLLYFLTCCQLECGEGRRGVGSGIISLDHNDKEGDLNVRLDVPKYVKVNDTVVLGCRYSLRGETMYTMKWYKGLHEFYRYTPKEIPPIKTFPIPGAEVLIDVHRSNDTQLTLKKVDLNMTGRYSCEVTTDAPDFTTELKSDYIQVIGFPREKPYITNFKPPYSIGDEVQLYCYSNSSRPSANITWIINGEPAKKELLSRGPKDSVLRFRISSSNYRNGKLNIRCLAEIFNLYRQSAEVTIPEESRPHAKLSSVVDNSSSSASASNLLKNSKGFLGSGSDHQEISKDDWLLFAIQFVFALLAISR